MGRDMVEYAERVYQRIVEQIVQKLFEELLIANSDPANIDAAKRKYEINVKKARDIFEYLKHQSDDPG
jgi:hypothetical protein